MTGLAVLVGLASLPFAVIDGRAMARGTACEREAEWNRDVVGSEQLDREWFPPRVRCRYTGYFRPSPSVPQWEDRWSVVVAPGAFLLAAVGALAVRRQARAGA